MFVSERAEAIAKRRPPSTFFVVLVIGACMSVMLMATPGIAADPSPRDLGGWLGWAVNCSCLKGDRGEIETILKNYVRDRYGQDYYSKAEGYFNLGATTTGWRNQRQICSQVCSSEHIPSWQRLIDRKSALLRSPPERKAAAPRKLRLWPSMSPLDGSPSSTAIPATPDTIAQQFEALVFSHQSGITRHRLQRWDAPPKVFVDLRDVEPIVDDRRFTRLLAQLEELTGLKTVRSRNAKDATLTIKFAPLQKFAGLMPAESLQGDLDYDEYIANAACLSGLRIEPRSLGSITESTVLIAANVDPAILRWCSDLQLVQAFGLQTDACHYRPSLFCAASRTEKLTAADKIVIRTLYDPRMSAGMTKAVAMPLAREIIADQLKGKVVVYPKRQMRKITSEYGSMFRHDGSKRRYRSRGISIIAAHRTPVLASASGMARPVGPPSGAQRICIDHRDDHITCYGYLAERLIKERTQVERGEVIGFVGKRRASYTEVHQLYFELWRSAERIDPHLAWAKGYGKVTCFDPERRYPTDKLALTYPLAC